MGRAARLKGKTLDDRIANAKQRAADETARIQNLISERATQELQGIKTMVWWQIDMTIERYERIERYRAKRHMKTAKLMSLMSMFGVYSFINPRRMR
jgi:ribosomal protein S13